MDYQGDGAMRSTEEILKDIGNINKIGGELKAAVQRAEEALRACKVAEKKWTVQYYELFTEWSDVARAALGSEPGDAS